MPQKIAAPAGELTKDQVKLTKGLAILFMLFLHLFCRTDTADYYNVYLRVGDTPLIYYFALFTEICVAIYAFCSGYGLFYSFQNSRGGYGRKNGFRILKLLCNYWVILLLTCAAGLLLGMGEKIPGSAWDVVAHVLLLKKSYCGAWWFLQTYVLLVLLSPLLFRLVQKVHPALVLAGGVLLYFASYLQKYRGILPWDMSNDLIGIPVNAAANLMECLFPFLMGALCLKYKVFSRLAGWIEKVRFRNLLCLAGIAVLILAHIAVPSAIVNPFLAVPFILLFNLMRMSRPVSAVLHYFARHSTNLWLTHMLFYMVFLPGVVFYPRITVVIFLWLLVLCLAASYAVNLLYHPLERAIDRLQSRKRA